MVAEDLGEYFLPFRARLASSLVRPLVVSMLSSARSVHHAVLVASAWRCSLLAIADPQPLHPLHGHTPELLFFIKTIAKILLLVDANTNPIEKILIIS